MNHGKQIEILWKIKTSSLDDYLAYDGWDLNISKEKFTFNQLNGGHLRPVSSLLALWN